MEFVEGNTVTYWLEAAAAQLAGGPEGLRRGGARAGRRRTKRGSSTATSSPTTSWSAATARCASWTSASRARSATSRLKRARVPRRTPGRSCRGGRGQHRGRCRSTTGDSVDQDAVPARAAGRGRRVHTVHLRPVRRPPHAHRRHDGNARLHGARAVLRHGDRRAHRSVQLLRARSTRRSTASGRSRGTTSPTLTAQRRAGAASASRRRARRCRSGCAGSCCAGCGRRRSSAIPSMRDLLDGARQETRDATAAEVGGRRGGGAGAVALRLRRPPEPGRSPGALRRWPARSWPASGICTAGSTRGRRGSRDSHSRRFMRTGKSYAVDVYATVSRALTSYAQSWANMYSRPARRRRSATNSRPRCSICGCPACRSAWAGCARSPTCSATPTARSSRTPSARPTLWLARSLRRRAAVARGRATARRPGDRGPGRRMRRRLADIEGTIRRRKLERST